MGMKFEASHWLDWLVSDGLMVARGGFTSSFSNLIDQFIRWPSESSPDLFLPNELVLIWVRSL